MADQSSSPPTLIRQCSTSTGLSYLASSTAPTYLRKLYILVHGWACTASDYAPLLSALSAPEREELGALHIALDLPSHGYSPQSLCPDPAVVDFAALINKIRYELSSSSSRGVETVLVGHSMGCRIALEAFAQEPTNVTGMVLLDGSWYGPSPKYESYPKTKEEQLPLMLKTLAGMFGPLTPEAFKDQKYQQIREIDLEYENRLSEDYVRWDGERMEDVLRMVGMGDKDATRQTRILIVQSTEGHGAKRKSLKVGEEGPWMRLVKNTVGERYQAVVVEGCGHWPHVDKVEEVADAIVRFGERN
jgi:pimeloyl-ACP methyl ester carboxylesterase